MNSLTSIQILRAVAAWLVVFHHEYQLFPMGHIKLNPQLGFFGVDLFFIISGFIMFYSLAKKECAAKEFFIKRLIRIVPAYWFFTFALVFISWLYTKEFSYTGWNLKTLIASLFFIVTNNPAEQVGYFPFLTVGWTLSLEMFFYFWLSACMLFFGKFRFLACTMVLILFSLLWDIPEFYRLSNKILLEFVFGIVIGYGYVRLKNIRPCLLNLFGFATLLLFGTFWFQIDFSDIMGRTFVLNRSLSACLLVSAFLFFESALSKIKFNPLRFFKYLGDISYSTYLVHPIVIGIILHYIKRPGSIATELLLMFITSMVIMVISHLSYRYIEVGLVLKLTRKRAVS
jgi:peptidoglycan/LPS O-acetylase OafA/YrhL